MRTLRNFIATVLLLASASSFAMSPLGEEAFYQLDRSRARTSSIIREGSLNIRITAHLPDEPKGPVYRAHYNYDLTVSFMGRQVGEDDMNVPTKYFEPAFLEQVKSEGQVETEEFKIKYIGKKDVTTISGETYQGSEVVMLYDINLQKLSEMSRFVSSLLYGAYTQLQDDLGGDGVQYGPGQFEEVKITAALKQGEVPVIGAVQVDVSAVRQGFPIKVGFDFQAPRIQSEQ